MCRMRSLQGHMSPPSGLMHQQPSETTRFGAIRIVARRRPGERRTACVPPSRWASRSATAQSRSSARSRTAVPGSRRSDSGGHLVLGRRGRFGLSVIPVARYLIVHDELPTVPVSGFRAFGTVPFGWLLAASSSLSVAKVVTGCLLWDSVFLRLGQACPGGLSRVSMTGSPGCGDHLTRNDEGSAMRRAARSTLTSRCSTGLGTADRKRPPHDRSTRR